MALRGAASYARGMRSLIAFALVALTATTIGCAKKPPAKDTTDLTSARAPKRNVAVADELMKACKIQLSNVDRAPKFDFDDADLLPVNGGDMAQM